MNLIRPIAICVFLHQNKILVSEGYDPIKAQTFYRPLGGMLEFGERGEDAIRREIHEELDAEVTDVRFLSLLESIFTYNGQPHHELVLVYDGRFINGLIYESTELSGREAGDEQPFKVLWKSLADFGAGHPPLYPEGLLDLLA